LTYVHFTGTFKLKKSDLQKAGFDLALTKGDPIYLLDPKSKEYVPFTQELCQKVMTGQIRL
jgi:hypothetical protein